jgi:formylmethanofuran dehydrogenase subunit A
VVYREDADRERMFAAPEYVFKDGELVARDGRIVKVTWGATHVVKPEFDRGIERRLEDYFARFQTMRLSSFAIGDDELCECGHGRKGVVHPCRKW